MKRMTRGLPLCAAVLAMMTACGGNGSDGKEGMPMRQKIEQLRKKIHDNNLEVEKRREYIEQLQKIVPDYVAKISEEGRVYEESTEALDKYIQKIKEKAMVDGAKAKMEELAAERAELVAERDVVVQDDGISVHLESFTLTQVPQCHGHVVGAVEFDEGIHLRTVSA